MMIKEKESMNKKVLVQKLGSSASGRRGSVTFPNEDYKTESPRMLYYIQCDQINLKPNGPGAAFYPPACTIQMYNCHTNAIRGQNDIWG